MDHLHNVNFAGIPLNQFEDKVENYENVRAVRVKYVYWICVRKEFQECKHDIGVRSSYYKTH